MWKQPCDLSVFIIVLNKKKNPPKTRTLNDRVTELKTTSAQNDTYTPKYITPSKQFLIHS